MQEDEDEEGALTAGNNSTNVMPEADQEDLDTISSKLMVNLDVIIKSSGTNPTCSADIVSSISKGTTLMEMKKEEV